MKLAQLLAELQAIHAKHGDIPVCFDSNMATDFGKYNLPPDSEITTTCVTDSGPGTDYVCFVW